MSILLISDIHLSNKKPNVVKGFLHFLNHYAIKAQALYILGDLFEIWLGDDHHNSLHTNIAKSLKNLHKKQIPCYFIHGNHDFLLRSRYANLCGITLLPNEQVLKLTSGKNVVILHGDSLCTNDRKYKKFKKILNCHILQEVFLSLPLFIRLGIFNIINYCFIQVKKDVSKKKLNIHTQTVIDILIKNKSEIMIHGHTHQPAVHNILFSKKIYFKRIVLGCWNQYGSMVKINEEDNSISLITFPLNPK